MEGRIKRKRVKRGKEYLYNIMSQYSAVGVWKMVVREKAAPYSRPHNIEGIIPQI